MTTTCSASTTRLSFSSGLWVRPAGTRTGSAPSERRRRKKWSVLFPPFLRLFEQRPWPLKWSRLTSCVFIKNSGKLFWNPKFYEIFRSKRLAPTLIREITRRVNKRNIFQACYTAGVVIPKPVSTARYHHRSLNPKKLVEIQFSALGRNQVEHRFKIS